MKKILQLLIALSLVNVSYGGSIVHVCKGNGAQVNWLIGIFETQYSFLPVFAAYQWGVGTADISVESISTELEFPSILFAYPSIEIPKRTDYPLYIQGEITPQGFDLKDKTWIKSRYLGWLYVTDYPTVFSKDDGWLYIAKNLQGLEVYYVYSFRQKQWIT